MPIQLDQELGAILADAELIPPTPRGDVKALREATNLTLQQLGLAASAAPNVQRTDYQLPVDGGEILVRWYAKTGSTPGSAVAYAHGGGMVCGSVDLYDSLVADYVESTGVPFLSVDYRLAPEVTGTTLVNDTLAALQWLIERAGEFAIDPSRIAIMGDSGGGGVAAGVAIAARDAGIALKQQILIYPMLDDRNLEPDSVIAPTAAWTYDNNYTGWNALLGADLGSDNVSEIAAPARLTDFGSLAPAFIDVGDLDIFRDEDIEYALNLLKAGVSTELHVRPGCIHAFDRMAPASRIGQRTWADRFRAIESL